MIDTGHGQGAPPSARSLRSSTSGPGPGSGIPLMIAPVRAATVASSSTPIHLKDTPPC